MPHRSDQMIRIATCCYCGARSTLRAQGGHRLVCHGCGAPIRRIESVPLGRLPRQPESAGNEAGGARRKHAVPRPAEPPGAHRWKDRPVRRKKGKRRRGGLLYRLREAFDDIDDIFDDLFD